MHPADQRNRERTERLMRVYEDRVLGRRIQTLQEGWNAIQWVFTPAGKAALKDAFQGTP